MTSLWLTIKTLQKLGKRDYIQHIKIYFIYKFDWFKTLFTLELLHDAIQFWNKQRSKVNLKEIEEIKYDCEIKNGKVEDKDGWDVFTSFPRFLFIII